MGSELCSAKRHRYPALGLRLLPRPKYIDTYRQARAGGRSRAAPRGSPKWGVGLSPSSVYKHIGRSCRTDSCSAGDTT